MNFSNIINVYLETTAPPTSEPSDDDFTFPAGTNCQGNIFSGWDKIVGGQEVNANSWNFIVSLDKGFHYCGGSIVNNEWIITAAHCEPAVGQDVKIGMHNIYEDDSEDWVQFVKILAVVPHPEYQQVGLYGNDIALLKVEPMNLDGDLTNVVCFPGPGQMPPVGDKCFVAGWGALYEGGWGPENLYAVDVNIYDDEVCENSYGSEFAGEVEICAGWIEGGKDSCQGDSGGPMVCIENGEPVLTGIVSWGEGCARPGYTGVYTEVQNYIVWMEEVILEGIYPTGQPNSTWEPTGDWNTTGDWNSTDWTTPNIPECGDECLIPEGTNCQGNFLTGWNKIVGGAEAVPNSWNFIVSIQSSYHYCGGSVLSSEWVVTAAHCTDGIVGDTVNVGYHDVNGQGGNTQTKTVLEVYNHPLYGSDNSAHDIALLRIEPLDLDGEFANMVCLPDQGELPPVDETCYVAGWGALWYGGPAPEVLQSVDVTIYSDDTCANSASYGSEFVGDFEVCAGKFDGGKDSCQGDSGGPLVCVQDGQPVLVGVVSWGYGCASAGYPGVYAETNAYIDWMKEITGAGQTTESPDGEY